MPMFRTGGGFSLTQQSPRQRAAHDMLPPQAVGMTTPRYLTEILAKLPDTSDPMGPRAARPCSSRRSAVPQLKPTRIGLSFELPNMATSAPASARMVDVRRADATTAPTGAPTPATGTPVTVDARSTPRKPLMPSSASGDTRAAPPPSWIGTEPGRAGLQGFTPRQARLGLPSSPPRPAKDIFEATVALPSPIPTPSRAAMGGDGACAPGTASVEAVAYLQASLSPRGHVDDSAPIGVGRIALGAGGRAGGGGGGGGGGGRGGSCGGGSSASLLPTAGEAAGAAGPASPQPVGSVACVPFPSLRHAHHLASIAQPPAPRCPVPPAARDESAVDRVSNYSIRPCIHDASLSARFGVKAACRSTSPLPQQTEPHTHAIRGGHAVPHAGWQSPGVGVPTAAAPALVRKASAGPLSAAAALGLTGVCGEQSPIILRSQACGASGGAVRRPGVPRVTINRRANSPPTTGTAARPSSAADL